MFSVVLVVFRLGFGENHMRETSRGVPAALDSLCGRFDASLVVSTMRVGYYLDHRYRPQCF